MTDQRVIGVMDTNNPPVYEHWRTKTGALMNMNIIPAFELANAQGAHGIALAVYRLYDTTVDATTDGTDQVAPMLRQLKALDAGSWFTPTFASVPIPTLDEVFEAVSQHDRAME